MPPVRLIAALSLVAALAACTLMRPPASLPPARRSPRRARRSAAGGEYPLPDGGTRLEFRQRGKDTYMLDFDAGGRLVAEPAGAERRRPSPTIQPGMPQDEVLTRLGRPACVVPGRLAEAAGLELPLRRPRRRLRRLPGLDQQRHAHRHRGRDECRPALLASATTARTRRSAPRPQAASPARAARVRSHPVAAAARGRQAASSCRSTNGRMPPCL